MRRAAGAGGGTVPSPCINVCTMAGDVCAGCLRSLDEIARWAAVDDDGKRQILAAVALRRTRLAADSGRGSPGR